MAMSKSVESFWNQLDQSGLIPSREVRVLARSFDNESVTSDAIVARKLVELGHLTRFQADRLLEGRSRGFFFDRYKLLDLIGVGGMGWVYRAQNIDTGEQFAMKILLDHFKHDRGLVVRFEQEARASIRFKHENIVRTHAFGTAGGLPYVVMEFVEGPSLLELLRMREKCRLPWEQACDVARQAALALQQVHQAGFIHRDIKPQNLLIDHSGTVKLLDFGLAMYVAGEEGDEFSMAMIFGHECVGTAAFMPPEQIVDSLKADARSDVYGLGCTLYATLIGDTPFSLPDTREVLKAHQHTPAKNVCDLVPSIPKPVGEIVARMLAKNPADRFQTATEVAEALAVWATRSKVEFDFNKVLEERNKTAREKLAEFQRRQKSSTTAASSTARHAPISTTSISSTGAMRMVGLDSRSQSASSSIARSDPYGFEHPPAITVNKPPAAATPERNPYSTAALKLGMTLVPPNGEGSIPLVKDRFVIGRGGDCDLQIKDSSVSTHHCELVVVDDEWVLNDLNSRNGVRVNGETVNSTRLKVGDVIIIGSSLRLRIGGSRKRSSKSAIGYTVTALVLFAVIAALLLALSSF